MGFVSVLSFAQQLIQKKLRPGDLAIDATVGTGADTLFLSETVGAKGTVYGFDIQQSALEQAQLRLEQEKSQRSQQKQPHSQKVPFKLSTVQWMLRNHAEMAEALPREHIGKIGAVMFNLGYLPGADDLSVMTTPSSTIPALEAALSILRPKGIMTIIVYPGHDGGGAEALAVQEWAQQLPKREAQVISYRQLQKADAPYLIAIEKYSQS
ncbi:class I SAM-dependent methyltransferase [Saccharibacillus sp. JS10]|uniref:class I SAM-dependent methyltransferase n=1 Tax=Saccharibacillus sp. JS10 TaxID=2950552 RepID=UPI00210A49D7|nr:class I SAM-dependent methyltransferase [Saccharibacillus sp. JS10]MCQ4086820.1 methyltransferase domain-containing protein [Saccharibacillus sp. JS10]